MWRLDGEAAVEVGEAGLMGTTTSTHQSLSHRPVGELSNTGVGAMGLREVGPSSSTGRLSAPRKVVCVS